LSVYGEIQQREYYDNEGNISTWGTYEYFENGEIKKYIGYIGEGPSTLSNVREYYENGEIKKYEDYENEEYIRVEVEIKDGTYACIEFPDFKKGTRYKGMELDRYYTVEELDLEEN
jgi:hypothetical protein